MVTQTKLGRIGLALALMATINVCTQSADRMSGAALPQEEPPAAANVDAGAVASDTLGTLSDAAVLDPAPNAISESEAANPWGALAVPADQAADEAAVDAAAEPPVVDGITDLDASGGGDAAALSDGARALPAGIQSTGSPSDCKEVLKRFDPGLKAGGYLKLAITVIPARGQYIGYAEGYVSRVLIPAYVGGPTQPTFVGNFWQQFSDRRVPDSCVGCKKSAPRSTPTGPKMPDHWQLFSEQRLDKLGVSMDVATGITTLKLYSWSNATVRLTPTCDTSSSPSVIQGYEDWMHYMMTLNLTNVPPPVFP